MQLEITFTPQNSAANQAILDRNKGHLNKQCQVVYDAMLRGEILTTSSALIKYGIGDLRARCRDLIKAGIPVQKRIIEGRYKEYYL